MRSNPAREQRTLVGLGKPLKECVEPDLVDERLGDRAAHDAALARLVVEQVRRLKLGLEVVELARELVRDDSAGFRALQPRVLLPDARELRCRILGDLLLDVLDVALVELGGLAVLEDHEVDVLLRGKSQAGKDLQ